MTAIEKAIAALEILFEYTNNEATEHPWWGITRQSKIGVIGEVLLAGPFFSRESATNALEAQRYHFGKHARVYCFSASRGNDYPRLVNSAREGLSELRAAQGEKVELDKETYLIALCAWNNVPLDNAAMVKYTEENFGKAATDSWQRVYDAIAARLQLERQR